MSKVTHTQITWKCDLCGKEETEEQIIPSDEEGYAHALGLRPHQFGDLPSGWFAVDRGGAKSSMFTEEPDTLCSKECLRKWVEKLLSGT